MKDQKFNIRNKPRINGLYLRFLIFLSFAILATSLVIFGINVKSLVKEKVTMLGYGAFGQSTSHISALKTYFSEWVNFDDRLTIPIVVIEIQDGEFDKIIQKREQALLDGILIKTGDDSVPGKILYDDNKLDISIRLKGDWTAHLKHKDKWSFRIQMEDELFLGMEEFSIQHPKQREFQSERLFYSMLKDFEIITPRHFFVLVVINNHSIGVMALEEHFSEQMLENNNKPEGVIFKFSEDLLWNARVQDASVLYENFYNDDIIPFDKKAVFKDPYLSKEFTKGKKLLSSLKKSNIAPSDVFDIEKIGRYLAIVDIWGARHALFWHNLRFYLNPETGKMEPIAFDASMSYREHNEDRSTEKEQFSRLLMSDELILEAYIRTLDEVSDYLESNTSLYQLDNKLSSELQDEFYYVPNFDLANLKYRLYNVKLDTVSQMVYNKDYDLKYVDLLKSDLFSLKKNSNILAIENISPFSIKILNITDESGALLKYEFSENRNLIHGRNSANIELDLIYPLDMIKFTYQILNQDFIMNEVVIRQEK